LTHISLSAIPAFLRPEVQALRRPVPEDFTPEQRHTFAVFSGSGVHRLKRTLWTIAAEEDGFPDAEFYPAYAYDEEYEYYT
jgi:F-box and leucine-rich repeat protein GRR1